MKERKPGKELKDVFRYDGNFYSYTGKLFDLIAVNFFWILGSLLIVTAGVSFCAMYDTVTNSVRKDKFSVGKRFWHVWKRDLVQSVILWTAFLGVVFLLLLNMGIIGRKTGGLVGMFFIMFYILCLAIVIMAGCYAFPALSRFKMSLGWIIKLAFYMTFRYFPISLLLLALFGAAYFLLLWQPFLIFIIPGVFTLAASVLVEPLLERHSPGENIEI